MLEASGCPLPYVEAHRAIQVAAFRSLVLVRPSCDSIVANEYFASAEPGPLQLSNQEQTFFFTICH
jgi:hypothetical protein